MTNFIPIFPLEIVVYPGELLNLHIFEPRYKQMIKECAEGKKPFGIPVVLDQKVSEWGTLLEIETVVNEYENGEMDIRSKGMKVFRVLEMVKSLPDKLYSGAIVSYPENNNETNDSKTAQLIISEVKRMYSLMSVEDKFPNLTEPFKAYELAHYVGLKIEQEYELLTLMDELQRMEYLRRHLKKMEPMLHDLEKAKERIKLNGHFRDLNWKDINDPK